MPTNQQNKQTGSHRQTQDDSTRDRKNMSGDTGSQQGKSGQGRDQGSEQRSDQNRDDANRGGNRR